MKFSSALLVNLFSRDLSRSSPIFRNSVWRSPLSLVSLAWYTSYSIWTINSLWVPAKLGSIPVSYFLIFLLRNLYDLTRHNTRCWQTSLVPSTFVRSGVSVFPLHFFLSVSTPSLFKTLFLTIVGLYPAVLLDNLFHRDAGICSKLTSNEDDRTNQQMVSQIPGNLEFL